jgi:hypothetical protein
MPSNRHKGKGRRKTGRTILLLGLGAGLVLLAVKASGTISRLKETQADLTIETSGRVHKVDLSGITLAVDVKVKNPNRSSVTFRHPFVKLIHKGKDLMSSALSKDSYSVESYGEKEFTILFKSSFGSLMTMVPDLYKTYVKEGMLKLTVYTKTEIYAIANLVLKDPLVFPKTEEMSFGNGSSKQLPA